MANEATSMTDLAAELWRKKFGIVFVTILCVVLTYVALSFVPKMYESSASILVEARSNIFLRAVDDTGASAASGVTDDVLMSSQVELIKSADTLLLVSRELGLDKIDEFSAKKSSLFDPIFALMGQQSDVREVEQIAIARLLKQMTVIRQRDSRVISIYVRSEDRQLAAKIANALALALISRRADQGIDDTAEATKWLETEIAKLRTRVSGAESAVARYRVENDLFVGTNNTTLVVQQLSSITAQITATQERKNTARSRANLIRELLNSGRSITGVSDVQNSVVIQRLAENKANLSRDRAQLLSTLLPSHPEIASLTAQINEMSNQITSEGARVAEALEVEAQIESSLEVSLRDDLARLKLSASDASTSNVRLVELEREANAQRDLLETYLLRYRDAVARTDSSATLPDLRQITIATPALRPVSPQTMMIMVAVMIAAIMMQLGVIILRHFASSLLRPEDFEKTTSENAAPVAVRQRDEPITTASGDRGAMRQRASAHLQAARQKSRKNKIFGTANAATIASNIGSADELADLIKADAANLVLFVGYGEHSDYMGYTDQVAASLIDNGATIALVDASSKEKSREVGLTDLAADKADFGDVVIETEIDELTEVKWGRQSTLRHDSEKPITLVEALCDMNDVVMVPTGIAGHGASLQMFAGADALLVVVADQVISAGALKQITTDCERLGLTHMLVAVASIKQRDTTSALGLVSA